MFSDDATKTHAGQAETSEEISTMQLHKGISERILIPSVYHFSLTYHVLLVVHWNSDPTANPVATFSRLESIPLKTRDL